MALLSHRDLQDIFRVGSRAGWWVGLSLGPGFRPCGFWVLLLTVDSGLDPEGSG